MQTKYLMGTIMVVSVFSASLAGFLFARFEYQPQIESMKTDLSQLNSEISGLQSDISVLEANSSKLQSENAELRSKVAHMQSIISELEVNYSKLQSEIVILEKAVRDLNNTIGNFSLVTDSSYYIFKQNDTYYAKNGLTGQIERQNDSCSSVINYTLAHVPYGGAVIFKPLASSDDAYYIDNTIIPPNGTTLTSENRMVTICLNSNATVPAVIGLYNVSDVQVSNIRIDGNKANNASGCGIIITSNSSYASDHLIENVEIDNCNGTGMWIQYYPLNNVLRNVKVFHSEIYNVRVESADNKLLDVESGWAVRSGFHIDGVDNYLLNCMSYGCGQAGPGFADGNGFSIRGENGLGARNMLVGCDAGANFQAGFDLAHAIQTMLVSCVGRDNGRTHTNERRPGRWGFNLYHSNSTILSGCLSTDENENKTQDWGYSEGEDCDYNIVIGCNFEGNNIGAVANLVGIHSVITNTIGYETKNSDCLNFRYGAVPIDIGTNNTYGTPKNFTSKTRTIVDFHVTVQWSTNASFHSDENVTVMVQALLLNGTKTSLETSRSVQANVAQAYALGQEDASRLWADKIVIQEIIISARTAANATNAEVKVYVWGKGS